jgi:sterol desaturase/sphingolipid hydroxylase (fatty acid hydroxylase superfamily)
VTPLSAVAAAVAAAEFQWGLLNQFVMPELLKITIGVIALDLVLYLQHVLFHAVPALWRLHMVHHADPDFDVTTGVRFHTIEILLSMLLKVAVVAALGPPAVAVVVFEVLLNASSMFNHSNIRMPGGLDRILRLIVVTPDMHRVHHSKIRRETNSNFGFNLPWWDYALGTYRAQPSEGHETMQIGLKQIPPKRAVGLHWLLSLPFIGQPGEYPINRDA